MNPNVSALLGRTSQALCLFLLVACGNANDGISFRKKAKTSANATSTALRAPLQPYTSCKNLSPAGSNGSAFQGTLVCKGVSNPSLVLVKVGGFFPVNARLCLIPWVGETYYSETCFNIDGQAEVAMTAPNYNGLVLLAETDLSAYRNFVLQGGDLGPARGIALMP